MSLRTALLAILAAFLLGAGSCFLLMRGQGDRPLPPAAPLTRPAPALPPTPAAPAGTFFQVFGGAFY